MASSMGDLPIIVTAALASVWEACGMELLIFSMTFFFAGVLRKAGTVQARPRKVCKLPTGEEAMLERKPTTANSTSPAPARAFTRRSSLLALDAEPRRLVAVLDETVAAAKAQPGARADAWALAQYAKLRNETDLLGMSISQVARFSRWSASDMYDALISCAVRSKRGHLVIRLMEDMVCQGVTRPMSLYESAMKQLASQKLHHFALDVYDRMAADGLEPSAVTCSCLISFAAEAGELDRAIDFFRKLQAMTTPSIRAYMAILRVYCRRADWPASLATLRDMEERGVCLDTLTLNVALATCVAAGKLDAAEELLEGGREANPPISDVVSFNTLIKGYAAVGDLDGALRVLERMKTCAHQPNAITMNTAIDAAVRSNRLDQAWVMLARMRSDGIVPDKFTCSILVKGARKAMNVDHCIDVLDVLQEVGNGCDAAMRSLLHHSLLDAAASIPDRALVLQIAERMQFVGISINERGRKRMRELAAATCG